MKARFSYLLLFLVPGVMAAGLVALAAGAVLALVLWILVYIDRIESGLADMLILIGVAGAFIVALVALLYLAYKFGKSREPLGGPSGRHVAFAIVSALFFPAIVALHQWSVGNLG